MPPALDIVRRASVLSASSKMGQTGNQGSMMNFFWSLEPVYIFSCHPSYGHAAAVVWAMLRRACSDISCYFTVMSASHPRTTYLFISAAFAFNSSFDFASGKSAVAPSVWVIPCKCPWGGDVHAYCRKVEDRGPCGLEPKRPA